VMVAEFVPRKRLLLPRSKTRTASDRRLKPPSRTGMMPLDSPIQNEPEPWRILCEHAANEQDLDKLLQLVREINRLLIRRLLREGKLLAIIHVTFAAARLA
jgi:hypothetical protein